MILLLHANNVLLHEVITRLYDGEEDGEEDGAEAGDELGLVQERLQAGGR